MHIPSFASKVSARRSVSGGAWPVAIGLIVAAGLLGPQPARAQPSTDAPAWATPSPGFTAPRTPWGDPDLQGIWPAIDAGGTPFERPLEFGERAELTAEEIAERRAQYERQTERDAETRVVEGPGARLGTGPPSHWAERGRPGRQTSLIVDPGNGRLPPMTPEGGSRQSIRSTYYFDFPDRVEAHPFNTFSDLGPYDRCISRGLLASMLPTGYNMGTQILQVPGSVVIVNEMIHETRVIPLDGQPHLGPAIRQYLGDSRGHWEGETLVVETKHFNGKVGLTLNGNSTPVSPEMRIVERFTLLDVDTLLYEATVDDPGTWTRPFTVALPLERHSDYQMFEYACHEGNYGMHNILSGARAAEEETVAGEGGAR